jgi:hypothetical protein
MSLVLDVDGRRNEVDAPAETALLYVLRNDLRAYGPKLGKTICWFVSRPRQDDRCRSTGAASG